MKSFFRNILFAAIVPLLAGTAAIASPKNAEAPQDVINPEFRTPQRLRGRVDFWKDIFSTYTKYQIVIHDKDFPQVRFGVVDLKDEGDGLSDAAYDSVKKKRVDAAMDEIKEIFKSLSDGHEPRNAKEKFIATKMVIVPGGSAKYRAALDNDLIRSQTGMREKFGASIARSGRYMQILEKVFVQDFGLPKELTRLPFVESSFDYEAYSAVGAAGIWQFMPGTARHFSMMVNNLVDERRDPLESTNAAAQYFSHAYNKLGTWPLAVISYNHGIAGVLKKVRAENSTDLPEMIERPFDKRPFGFASSNFYPSLLAAIEVYRDRRTLFPNLEYEPSLQLTKLRLNSKASIMDLSRQLGVSREALRTANYALADPIWQGRAYVPAGYVLKVPQRYEAKAEQLAQRRDPEPVAKPSAPAATNKTLKAPTIKIEKSSPTKGKTKEPAKQVEKKGKKTNSPVTTVYKAKAGDSLWSIARQRKIDLQDLIKLNPSHKKSLKAGDTITLPK